MPPFVPWLSLQLAVLAAGQPTLRPVAAPPVIIDCAPPSTDGRIEASKKFGRSEQVFVGRLERRNDAPAVSTDPSRQTGAREAIGTFAPREVFKGKPGASVEALVAADLIPGHDYLVFAEAAAGSLVAYAPCRQMTWDLSNSFSAPDDELAWLRALPAAGSGGEVRVQLNEIDHTLLPLETTLVFAGAEGTFTLSTNREGSGSASRVPAGAYRLTSKAPPGFHYTCPGDCTIVVRDRGHEEIGMALNALAALKVEVVDASGRLAKVRAQFELHEPRSEQSIGPLGAPHAYSSSNPPYAASGGLAPARYTIALVLPRFFREQDRLKVADKRVVFDGGRAASEAPVIQVHDGENVARFVLPAALQPVRTDLRVIGRMSHTGMPPLQLMIGTGTGGWSDRIPYPMDSSDADRAAPNEDASTFWSIPGQTLLFEDFGHKVDGNNSKILQPEHDGRVTLDLSDP